jgi:hypothetical protein
MSNTSESKFINKKFNLFICFQNIIRQLWHFRQQGIVPFQRWHKFPAWKTFLCFLAGSHLLLQNFLKLFQEDVGVFRREDQG